MLDMPEICCVFLVHSTWYDFLLYDQWWAVRAFSAGPVKILIIHLFIFQNLVVWLNAS